MCSSLFDKLLFYYLYFNEIIHIPLKFNFVFNFGIAEILGCFTLVATILGIWFARKAYKHQTEMVEPWSMKKVGDNLWLLERTVPGLAVITGVTNGFLCDFYQISWLNFAGFPAGYFKKGKNILLRIENPPPGATFELYYEEVKEERYPFITPYVKNMSVSDPEKRPKNWKVWSTSVY